MKEERGKQKTWVVAVVLGLLVSFGVGALAGGIAGYFVGRRTESRVRTFVVPRLEIPSPQTPEEPPILGYVGRGGAVILSVVENSPAERAGLRAGDIIVEVNKESLSPDADLAECISRYDPGDTIELAIMRGGRERTLEVKLGRHPNKGGETPWLGIEYRTMPQFEFHFEGPDRRRFNFDSRGWSD